MIAPTLAPPAKAPVDPPLLLTKSELADHLRVSERQVDLLRNQLPPAIRVGSSPRWIRQAVVDWIGQQ